MISHVILMPVCGTETISTDFDCERSGNWTDKSGRLLLKGETEIAVLFMLSYRQTVSGGQSIVDRQTQWFPFTFNNCTLHCGITFHCIL